MYNGCASKISFRKSHFNYDLVVVGLYPSVISGVDGTAVVVHAIRTEYIGNDYDLVC